MKKCYTAILLLIAFQHTFAQSSREESFRLVLKDDWQMQSVTAEKASGQQLSQPQFATANWYRVNVPTTIIAGLLANKKYDFDPFFGKNLEKLSDPSLDQPWWFRKEFMLPASENGKNVVLQLHGINYKASVWLNGNLIADTTAIKGPFRIFDLDVTKQVNYNGRNVLAIEITRPFNPNKRDGDLAIDYADWIHYPPDYNGGIVNDVSIKTYDKVGISHPMVTTHFDLPSLAVAHLEVAADVTNFSDSEQDALIRGQINNNIAFEQKIHLMPNEKKQVVFSPTNF